MKNNNLAAIYVRLSKEDLNSGGRESKSIQNQKSMLLDYAASKRWIVYKIYCDEDYSGAYSGRENTRPGFNRMIEDAKNGEFGIVLCKSQSRFSRNMEVIEQYVHGRFVEWGIRFVSLIDNADTEVKGNKKARQINSLINEWYLEDLSENIKAVFRDKMKRGEYLAPFPPYGYSKDPCNKNHLVVNPKTASVVKQIFRWHSEGFGAARISRMLNDRGIPNPRKQQEEDGLRKTYYYRPDERGLWSTTSIGDILHNQVYCGDVVQHTREKVSYKSRMTRKVEPEQRIIIKNVHEPIIDRGVFNAAQKRLSDLRKADGTGKVHVLSGKVYCHYCGKAMQKNHSKSTKGDINYLRCREKYSYSSNDKCPTPNIRIDIILKALQIQLIDKFKDAVIAKLDNDTLIHILFNNDDTDKLKEVELEKLLKEKDSLEKSLEHLYSDRLSEVISLEQYINYNKIYNEKLENTRTKITELQKELEDDGASRYDNIKESAKKYLDAKFIDREIIDRLVDRIEFGEINNKTNNPILKIFWAWE